jgi:esterase/lipase
MAAHRSRLSLSLVALALGLACCQETENEEVSHQKQGDDAPVVVVLGGSEGGYPSVPVLMQRLRSADISVAQIAYFGFPDGPAHLQEISIDAVSDEISALSQGHTCIGLIGISKGAELALLLAAHRPVSDVTIAVVPSHVSWQSPRLSLRNTASWTLDGEPVPFVPYSTISLSAVRAAFDYDTALPLHQSALEDEEAVRRASIPVEEVDQPVLLMSAKRDQVWPSFLMAKMLAARADRLIPNHNVTHLAYDHDHYLLRSSAALSDLVDYLSDALADC